LHANRLFLHVKLQVKEAIIMRKLIYLLVAIFLLSACGTTPNAGDDMSPVENQGVFPAEAETGQDDFIYRLVTEKEVYDEPDEPVIFAELTYVGDEESIDIYHAASPFYFPLEERTREFEIDYAMNSPLIVTTLKKDEPLRQQYSFAGGYDESDDEEYIAFIKALIDGNFPEGYYIIHGSAQFFTEDPSETTNEEELNLNVNIGFEVKNDVNQ